MLEREAEVLLSRLILADPLRCQALDVLAQLALPQAYIAAGFVRNRVWDYLHRAPSPSPLADIDVIYFDAAHCSREQERELETRCAALAPGIRWQVRNQARMHRRHGDRPYRDVIDAMAFWPELETAVAVRRRGADGLHFVSPFPAPLSRLFAGRISRNPQRSLAVFRRRLAQKRWLARWPALTVVEAYDLPEV